MALINCPECNHEVSDKAKACPNCGHPFKNNLMNVVKKSKCKIVLIIIASFIVLVIGGFYIFRGFWAKVFLSEEKYKLYQIYQNFKDISGIGGDCDTFYDCTSQISEYQGLIVCWIEEYDGVQLLCEGDELYWYRLYIPEEEGSNIDKLLRKGLDAEQFATSNDKFRKDKITLDLRYSRKSKIDRNIEELSGKRTIKLPFLFR